MQQLGDDARHGGPALLARFLVMSALHRVRQYGEPRRDERVQDRQHEDTRGHRVERLGIDPRAKDRQESLSGGHGGIRAEREGEGRGGSDARNDSLPVLS